MNATLEDDSQRLTAGRVDHDRRGGVDDRRTRIDRLGRNDVRDGETALVPRHAGCLVVWADVVQPQLAAAAFQPHPRPRRFACIHPAGRVAVEGRFQRRECGVAEVEVVQTQPLPLVIRQVGAMASDHAACAKYPAVDALGGQTLRPSSKRLLHPNGFVVAFAAGHVNPRRVAEDQHSLRLGVAADKLESLAVDQRLVSQRIEMNATQRAGLVDVLEFNRQVSRRTGGCFIRRHSAYRQRPVWARQRRRSRR